MGLLDDDQPPGLLGRARNALMGLLADYPASHPPAPLPNALMDALSGGGPSVLDQMRYANALAQRDFAEGKFMSPEYRAVAGPLAAQFNFLGNMRGGGGMRPIESGVPAERTVKDLFYGLSQAAPADVQRMQTVADFVNSVEKAGYQAKVDGNLSSSYYVSVLKPDGTPVGFKLRVSDHGAASGTGHGLPQVSIDPKAGNTLDDALTAFQWHVSDRSAPKPKIGYTNDMEQYLGRLPYLPKR